MTFHETGIMTAVTEDPRWQAIVNRDKRVDGQFVHGGPVTEAILAGDCALMIDFGSGQRKRLWVNALNPAGKTGAWLALNLHNEI